jgi:pimeloyl-ACP methyl ester carboxylesterase
MPLCENNGVKIYYRRYGHGSTKVLLIIGTFLHSPPYETLLFLFVSSLIIFIRANRNVNNEGLAGTHDSWGPQIKGLTGSIEPNDNDDLEAAQCVHSKNQEESNLDQIEEDEEGIEICCFDNRGMGRSSIPTSKSDYTSVPLSPSLFNFLFFFFT